MHAHSFGVQEHVRELTVVAIGSIADSFDPMIDSLGPRVEACDSETTFRDAQCLRCRAPVGSCDARTRTKDVPRVARRVQDRSCRPITHAADAQVAFCRSGETSVDPITSSCLLAKTSVDPITGPQHVVKASVDAIASFCRVMQGAVDSIASFGECTDAPMLMPMHSVCPIAASARVARVAASRLGLRLAPARRDTYEGLAGFRRLSLPSPFTFPIFPISLSTFQSLCALHTSFP